MSTVDYTWHQLNYHGILWTAFPHLLTAHPNSTSQLLHSLHFPCPIPGNCHPYKIAKGHQHTLSPPVVCEKQYHTTSPPTLHQNLSLSLPLVPYLLTDISCEKVDNTSIACKFTYHSRDQNIPQPLPRQGYAPAALIGFACGQLHTD